MTWLVDNAGLLSGAFGILASVLLFVPALGTNKLRRQFRAFQGQVNQPGVTQANAERIRRQFIDDISVSGSNMSDMAAMACFAAAIVFLVVAFVGHGGHGG